MLLRLSVRDLVVISALEIEFGPGLTVITGDSGAGKSILLEALGLALGARASVDRIRPEAVRAEASTEWALPQDGDTLRFLEERDLIDPDSPGLCTSRRTLDRKGRSRAFINDHSVTRNTLSSFAQELIDIHAQDENIRLAHRDVQLALFDDYALPAGERSRVGGAWRDRRRAGEELATVEAEIAAGADRRELLEYQIVELEELDPQSGEYEEIFAEHMRLSQVERLREAVSRAIASMENTEALGTSARELSELGEREADFVSACGNLDASLSLIGDAIGDLRRYESKLVFDPERAKFLDERLRRMHDIARKHHVTPEDLPEVRAKLAEVIGDAAAGSRRREELAGNLEQCEREYRARAKSVGEWRRAAAKVFETEVTEKIQSLGIQGGALVVDFTEAELEHGFESVEFLIKTHSGRQSAPLAEVASGGEQARISLAISLVAAAKSDLPCLVLDEADIGVGGVTADTIGRMLRTLADRTQVICVTHAPQVAALGNRHLRVRRSTKGNTTIEVLSDDGRAEELARMLSGATVTDKARAHARGLLDEAVPR